MLPATRSAWLCTPEFAAAVYLKGVSLAPAAFAPGAFWYLGGGLQRTAPQLLRSPPAPLGTRLPPPRWSSRKRRRAAGRWLRSGRSSCGTRGRTSSWAAPGPAGVRRAAAQGAGGGGPLGDAPGARGLVGVTPAPFPSRRPTPLRCSGLGGDQIAGLISLAGAAEAEKVGHCRLPAPRGAPSRWGSRALRGRVRTAALALALRGWFAPQWPSFPRRRFCFFPPYSSQPASQTRLFLVCAHPWTLGTCMRGRVLERWECVLEGGGFFTAEVVRIPLWSIWSHLWLLCGWGAVGEESH